MSDKTQDNDEHAEKGRRLTEQEERVRSRRNLAIAGLLVAFVAIVYFVTVARIGGDIANRPF